ncbi:MAG: AgmX/PglI C-terminal domain-containing protein, partial [Nitrospirota bacterium]
AARCASAPLVFKEKVSSAESAAPGYGEPAKEEKEKGSVSIRELSVSGGLEKKTAAAIIQKHLQDIHRCYLKTGNQGEAAVEFIVGSDGRVKSIKLVPDNKRNDDTYKCFTDGIMKWRFPVSAGMKNTTVTVTFYFNAV